MPTLFMRLKNGLLWYIPRFADNHASLDKWDAIINNIKRGRCTPILGVGMNDYLQNLRQSITDYWVNKYSYPNLVKELPQVAQYLAIKQDYNFPRDKLNDFINTELYKLYGDKLPNNISLTELIDKSGEIYCKTNPINPFTILANLPLPLFITTMPFNILDKSLIKVGKKPELELCRWNEDIAYYSQSIYENEPNYRPTIERPLIYQLFGNLQEPDLMVLTEDDYFDFLIGVTSNKELIPNVVRRRLVDSSLIFLGFKLQDWDFRIMFRSIINREGRSRRKNYAHIAVQIEPNEEDSLEPERTRQYLENYFESADINIFWGSVEDFIVELNRKLN
jgi:hypothetical protein